MTGDGILERMALGVIVVSSSGELWMLLKLQGSIGGYPTVAHVIIAGWSALTQLKTGEHRAIPFGEPEESHERDLDSGITKSFGHQTSGTECISINANSCPMRSNRMPSMATA